MSDLKTHPCTNPSWHGSHDFWWTESGGGHMLRGEPDEHDFAVEKNLMQYHCPGKGGTSAVTESAGEGTGRSAADPDSEQMFEAYDRGYKLGKRHMAERFVEALHNERDEIPADVLEQIEDLLKEAGIEP